MALYRSKLLHPRELPWSTQQWKSIDWWKVQLQYAPDCACWPACSTYETESWLMDTSSAESTGTKWQRWAYKLTIS